MWVRTVHWLVGVRPVFVLPALSDSGDCLLMLPVHLRDGLLVLLVGISDELVESADCVALHAVHALEEADRDGSPDEADYDEAPMMMRVTCTAVLILFLLRGFCCCWRGCKR